MEIKPGLRLKSQIGDTEVVVIKGTGDHELASGGVALMELGGTAGGGTVAPDLAEPVLLGKRYTDAEDTIELLCTKPGTGTLSLDGQPLAIKSTKALPASD